jgi:hypothetical protein
MLHKTIRFGRVFNVGLRNRLSQAAQMVHEIGSQARRSDSQISPTRLGGADYIVIGNTPVAPFGRLRITSRHLLYIT